MSVRAPAPDPPELGHTLGFCRSRDRVLMLRRSRAPFAGRWNGVGGKLAAGEAPEAGLRREIAEETPLRVDDLGQLRAIGTVSWTQHDGVGPATGGMHVFVVTMRAGFRAWEGTVTVAEGDLSWLSLREVLDPTNPRTVRNIARVLPAMLRQPGVRFHCDYRGETLLAVGRVAAGVPSLRPPPAVPVPVAEPEPETPAEPAAQPEPPAAPRAPRRRSGQSAPAPAAASQARARSARRQSS